MVIKNDVSVFIWDETISLSFGVPVLIILLITFLTDFYTFLHLDDNKQFSAYHVEDQFLIKKCKVCNTHCNDQSIVRHKVDVPLKSTSISFIFLALLCVMFSPQIFILPLYRIYFYLTTVLWFWTTANIPMIVCLSKKNNFANIAIAKQRKNQLAWNRTQNQKWEIKCAIENRNSENVHQKLKSEEIIVESKKSCMYFETDV